MNDNGEVKVADFDLDAWIDGTTGITGMARIVQRGDLLARRDQLQAELEVTKKIPAHERGMDDRGPEAVAAELDQVYEQIWDSMLWVHVQDRTEDRRKQLWQRLKKQGVDDTDIGLHVVADAIVKVETADGKIVPLGDDGFPPAKLRKIRERCGDAALIDLMRVFREVTASAPAVQAPLSRGSSSSKSGGTSRSRSARRGSGGSRRG